MNIKSEAQNRISCIFAIFRAKSAFYCFAQTLFTSYLGGKFSNVTPHLVCFSMFSFLRNSRILFCISLCCRTTPADELRVLTEATIFLA